MATSRLERVPAVWLAFASIVSVQFGSAVARTLFDSLGAAGITLLRLGLAQHAVEHDRVVVAIGWVIEVEAPTGRGLLRERLIAVELGKPLQALELTRLIEIQTGKRRAKPTPRKSLRHLVA